MLKVHPQCQAAENPINLKKKQIVYYTYKILKGISAGVVMNLTAFFRFTLPQPRNLNNSIIKVWNQFLLDFTYFAQIEWFKLWKLKFKRMIVFIVLKFNIDQQLSQVKYMVLLSLPANVLKNY